MQWFRKVLTLILALGAVAVGGLFSLQNTLEVPLDLMVIQLAPQPVAIWILLSLAIGVAMGLTTGSILALRRAATIRQLRKQRDRLLAASDQETARGSQ